MATRKWGSEKLVNSGLAGWQYESAVAGLAGGGFVVVWQDDSTADSAIRAQRYDAFGNPIGGEMAIAAGVGNDRILPSVTGLADGGFFVTWTQPVGGDYYILGSIYDGDGAFVRSQPTVFAFGRDDNAQVARLGTGSVVVWEDPDGNNTDILLRIFDAAGNGGPLIPANAVTAGVQRNPSVSASPDGSKIAVVWDYGADSKIVGRLLTSAGVEFAPDFLITSSGVPFGVATPAVAWLNNEQFAVAWRVSNPFTPDDNQIEVKIFDGRFSTVPAFTGSILVNSTMAGSQQQPQIAALPNGGFVVCWEDSSGVGGDPDFSIKLQAFDGAGGKIGGEVLVNTTTTGAQHSPSLSALPDGRVVVSWTDFSTGDSEVRAQIVDPRDGIVTGTPGDDVLFGHDAVGDEINGFAGADTLRGLGANDTLYGGEGSDVAKGETGDDIAYGGAGNDVLAGGAGDDQLYGDDGNDRLDGGAGVDTMTGGTGNDTYVVDNAGDTVIENNGEGTDRVDSSVSFSLAGRYIERLTLTGSGNINGTGNSLANSLTGNAGNNVLNGGTGADTMAGGAGNDTYTVDNAGDKVVENNGGGTDQVNSSVSFSLSGQYIERLTLTGSGNLNGTGNTVANILVGNAGNNFLNGGAGADVLTGGLGADTFVFRDALGASNIDTITDFNVAADTIQLDNVAFSAIVGTGTLSLAQFAANATGTAQDASDRIIYETDTGKLFYDSNGSAAGGAIQFAQLGAGLALTNADFTIV